MLGEITLTGLTSQGAPSSQLHNWRVGQVLEAVALNKSSAERLQLRIGNLELQARTQAPIQAGDRVLLKVLSAGNTPTLQVVPATVATGTAAEIVNQALRQLLPRQLPTERVLTNLLAALNQDQQRAQLPVQTRGLIETLLARIPRAEKLVEHTRLQQLVTESGLFREQHRQQGQANQGGDIKQALIQLARQLGTPQSTQGAVRAPGSQLAGSSGSGGSEVNASNSGSTTTAPPGVGNTARAAPAIPSTVAGSPGTPTVATTAAAPAGTPTASTGPANATAPGQPQPQPQSPQQAQQLAQQAVDGARQSAGDELLIKASQPSLQELHRMVEGGIARILLQQAQSLPQPNQDGVRWVFELPYRQGDEYHSLPMVIEREAQNDEPDALPPGWRVELSFELPELGVVQAKVLVRGSKISASLWAERETVAQLADAELPVLENALAATGLEVGALVCRQGQKQQSQPSESANSLLDYRI